MSDDRYAEVEERVRELCRQERYADAATITVDAFGGELLGFLVARSGSQDVASEAFSMFLEDLWRGLPKFEWRSRLRTWCYSIANNARRRYYRGHRPTDRLPETDSLFDVAEQVRSSTLIYLRTQTKDRFRKLRESLKPEERALLVLKVDRGLSWADIAVITLERGADATPEEIRRESNTLSQRFKRVKKRLRALAEAEGLLG